MSKKKSGDKKKEKAAEVCGRCKNFKSGKGCAGMCARRDKKRDCDDRACGSFKPR